MKIYALIAINLFVLSTANGAQEPNKWSAKCLLGKVQVSLEATSKSGDPYEDDMTVQIQIGKNKSTVSVGTSLFRTIESEKKIGICDKGIGIPINSNQFIFLLGIDNRPGLETLAALLVDTELGGVLDINKNLGRFLRNEKEQIQIEKTELGFKALMAQGWSKKPKTDSAKEIATGWINVSSKYGNIDAAWEKPLPETHKPYEKPNVVPAPQK